jgi:NAD(P)-dependent dehydrogenase (short-subunit alcohol dehydrogenase family)
MIPRRRGKIINFCSLLTFQGGLTVPAYAAAKGALGQLTKALSNEWSKDNVQVNAICPGYIATDMSVVRPALVYLISLGGFRPRHHRCGPHLPTPRRSADGTDRPPPPLFALCLLAAPQQQPFSPHFFYLPYLPARLLPCSPAQLGF